ncbi:MAG: single-stranded-DNA-specific exonuclease RecJ [Bacteroidetes bacterium CG18_big_fil_WC_8_21_14_2_50_41_14]|nr:MAG: single-stranded-DNA-specific exonuclease RecJ [Bacteroidetes bacterium CG18_big_fil_WC_8_21_14_2_50_41_14]PIY34557.1 MAG: single-stranded-DNA-specific exonuclease RecJ [Bacteroidetes bacterium CG_4_10_14_3_um_filter_42_6]PJB59314.1 MAG: single-stranded-DNA-specific exonuclease RecJ [Bacteroidetes bacterium CG_4_9_14_3_um_filter_41_19]
MEKRWVLKKKPDNDVVEQLSQSLNINKKLLNLLVQRGMTNYQEAKTFFRPKLENLHDPFLMKDMDKAVDRVLVAINNGEKILVYGDYDVDGTTAVSLVYSFLKDIYKKVGFYIPDRYTEGYGVSFKAIDYAVENDYKLMITLDCGIKAVSKVAYANQKGLDIIIGDHHRPGDKLPDAIAVLDPKQPDCHYPFKDLSGCGVGFKLVQAISEKKGISKERSFACLDLVAISIAADIVPIIGENRILAYYGLKQLNKNPRVGIQSLLKSAGVDEQNNFDNEGFFDREITISDIVFLLGPRINAAGRIESATDSVKLLISNNMVYAEKLGKQINELNTTRRDLDTNITQEAMEILNSDIIKFQKKSTVVYSEHWHKGVIGIVASRLIEAYYRPTIVLTKSDGLITGSARSIKNFDIYDAIESCNHLLEHFGGHMYAAGLALKPENLQKFTDEFEEYAAKNLTDEMLVPEIEIDGDLYIGDISTKFYRILKQFAPFGPGNMAPAFITDNVIDTGYVKLVGKGDVKHLKLSVVHPDRTGNPIPAIAFNMGEYLEKVQQGKPFSICYHIDENTWLGNTSLQLRILDMKFD